MKIKLNTAELVKDMPNEFLKFMEHLQSLEFSDKPDYDYLIGLLEYRFAELGGTADTPYDWQSQDDVKGYDSHAVPINVIRSDTVVGEAQGESSDADVNTSKGSMSFAKPSKNGSTVYKDTELQEMQQDNKHLSESDRLEDTPKPKSGCCCIIC